MDSNIARRQLADYDAHTPGQIFSEPGFSLTVDEAYRLQNAVTLLRSERGETVAGYKIGCISEAVQRQLGLSSAVFGHVFSNEVRCDGTLLDPAVFECLAIEGEFAVRMGADTPDPRELLHHPEDFIESLFPVIELHNHVFRGAQRTAGELIANNALHAGIVLPPVESPMGDAAKAKGEEISVYLNGNLMGAAALEWGPLLSVVRVAEHVASLGRTLSRGDIVLTGSPLPLYAVESGDRIMVSGRGVEVSCAVIRHSAD